MRQSGWGRFPEVYAPLQAPRDEATLTALVRAKSGVIARGNGRAYGDSAISQHGTIDMRGFNKMISFDDQTGLLVAEAGVLLGDVISSFLPRGWFPLVTPGTKFVTLGGMIAADVHGKNHHRDGSMRTAVEWLDIVGPDGEVIRATRDGNSELFDWSFGTMGLTGIILRVGLRLRPVESGWIRQTTIPAPNLAVAMEEFETNDAATYSVAWIDCLARGTNIGRSLVMLGEHATKSEFSSRERADPFAQKTKRKLRMSFEAPGFALSKPIIKVMNSVYYRTGVRKAGNALVDWGSYFYPLDAILDWNKGYGRRGFVQFQCALPLKQSQAGLEALLGATSAAGAGSFLAVLKRFGEQSGPFSFPMPGYTLALDFPATDRNLALLETLDAITLDHGGRFYLAKDARMSAQTQHASDPRSADLALRRDHDNTRAAFRSAQSERLNL